MSRAAQSVRTIRNAALESNLSLREQSPAERDEMRRCESVSESIESLITPLTARQLHAINLLAMGKTVVATAKSLDIGVSTLHRWKATHPLFKAELAQRQHNLFDAMIQKLRLTMSKAVDHLFDMMTSSSKIDRKEVMHEMLKLLRPQKFLVPTEPTSAQGVLDEAVREGRASRGESIGEEITEEERIAAIPDEFRVDENPRGTRDPGSRGAIEVEGPTDRTAPTARQTTTPPPSREWGASDGLVAKDEGAALEEAVSPRSALSENAHQAQSKAATDIASRPLPESFTHAEESQSAHSKSSLAIKTDSPSPG